MHRVARIAAVACGLGSLLALLLRPGRLALLVPLAGPWAGRLYGHHCGLADGSPPLALALAVSGVAAAAATAALPGRRLAAAPFVAWWVAWVLAALGSVANTLE